jgi:nucleoside-diphosphate-sugar epimerase
LFLTGASGFVGQRVLRCLADAGHSDVRVLTRDVGRVALPSGWRAIRGSLEAPERWATELAGCETVMHLASPTGKISKGEYTKTIVEGTRRLLDHATSAGVERFLFVSSCAAGFTARRYYHYAEAKRAAEESVRASALETLIVRPTMVFGRGSQVLAGLRTLAMLPKPVLFGSGQHVVQPIAVEDLAVLLVAALDVRSWNAATITAAGPEPVTLEALMLRIRAAVSGAPAAGRVMHLPLAPVRELLGLLEPLLLPVLPLTAGQLATFANDGHGEPHPMLAQLPAPRMDIAQMLAASGLRDG